MIIWLSWNFLLNWNLKNISSLLGIILRFMSLNRQIFPIWSRFKMSYSSSAQNFPYILTTPIMLSHVPLEVSSITSIRIFFIRLFLFFLKRFLLAILLLPLISSFLFCIIFWLSFNLFDWYFYSSSLSVFDFAFLDYFMLRL
jgi:hypothetical protein